MVQRKYNSQAMIDKILNTATQLFSQNGYEKTSMQMIARTAGISKGAIYHHFASKEKLISAIITQQNQLLESELKDLLEVTSHLSGKEQLQSILRRNLGRKTIVTEAGLDKLAQALDPTFLFTAIQDNLKIGAPLMAGIIKKGIADGSIQTEFPDEAAEVFLLLVNFWAITNVFNPAPDKTADRVRFIRFMMTAVGLDVFDEALEEKFLQLAQ